MNDKTYWAARPAKEAIAECENRRKDYYKYVNAKGFIWIWRLVNDFYHSATARSALSSSAGEWNELQDVKINDFRSLIQHKVGIVINQRPVWEPMAMNSDPTTLAQTTLAKAILSYYTEIKGYDKKMSRTANAAAKFGEGFIVQTWDASEGKLAAKLPSVDGDGNDTVTNIYEGDLDCRVHEPIDVIRDCAIKEHDQNHWYIIRQEKNKWDLAAKHPELYDEIVACSLEYVHDEHYLSYAGDEQGDDLVFVYTLYHKKTAALPQGRVISYIREDIILSADPMSYEDFPVHRMIDVAIPNTNFSYTDAFDMLQPADLLDGLWSTVITNQRAFGVTNIIMPIGANISESQIGGALNVIEYDAMSGGEPKALELLKTPPEIFNTIQMLSAKLNTLSGVNSTAQGNPPTGVTSGVALSMLQSLNVQYNQGLQENFVSTMTNLGTALVNLMKQNATTERVVQVVGKAKASLAESFTGKDLGNVTRVVARPGNPMMQTIQGRYSVAEMLASKGLVNNPSMLLTVLETGSLDVLTEGAEVENINIKSENEALREGKTVVVRPTDEHVAHLREHAKISADIHMRTAPAGSPEAEILQNVMAHEAEHIRQLGDPAFAPLLIALGQQPLQLAVGQMGYTPPPTPPAGAAPVPGPLGAPAAGVAMPQGPAPGVANPPPANQTSQAIGQPKPPSGTPAGQFPQGLINVAQKNPQQ
jgi:hypothetical protein